MYHIKHDCYADTKNISDSENWQLQIGNGFAQQNGGVSRHGVFRVRVATISCAIYGSDRRIISRPCFAVSSLRHADEPSPIIRVREIGSSCLNYRSLLHSIAPRILELQRDFTIPLGRRQDTTARNSSESCKQASVLGYTLPSRSLELGEEVGNRCYLETCSDIIRDFTSRSFRIFFSLLALNFNM